MKNIKLFLIIGLILSLFFNYKLLKGSSNEFTRIDTVEVVKLIKGKSNTFVKDSLIPVYIDTSKHYKELFKELEIKYSRKVDSITILQELLAAKKKRIYKESFNDSTLTAEIEAHTTGKLDSLRFTYTTKPQKVVYNEITKYKQPDFRILAGAGVNSNINYASVEFNVGFQNNKGYIFLIGTDTRKSVSLSAYIPLFTRY